MPRLLGTPRAKARPRAYELMALVGLTDSMAKRYPYQLSGGQQQRVGVARALAADPPMLLMDEPFSAVDPVVRDELQREFQRLQSQLHKTIVFVTHDIDEAVKLGDKIAVMQVGGHLVQFDTPERILARPENKFVENFVGVDRGIRWLSFFQARELRAAHARPPSLTDRVPADEAGKVAADDGTEWFLALDPDRRPVGWLQAAQLNGRASDRYRSDFDPSGTPSSPPRTRSEPPWTRRSCLRPAWRWRSTRTAPFWASSILTTSATPSGPRRERSECFGPPRSYRCPTTSPSTR